MPKKNANEKDSVEVAATPAAVPVSAPDEIAAKLQALREANAAALQTLSTHFGAEWAKIIQRCERNGLRADDIASLAGKMVSTRKAWHPANDKAALLGAANGFLCAIGLVPTADDVKAFESALAATAV